MLEMTGTVLDILIYVFDRYMLTDTPDVPERDELALDLERAGFAEDCVERALDWLADLAGERNRPAFLDSSTGSSSESSSESSSKSSEASSTRSAAGLRAMRIFTDSERARLPADCRGYLLSLERTGILSPQQREIVIERLLALDSTPSSFSPSSFTQPSFDNDELDVSQLKWVVLMVLSSQPGEELACSRMEELVFDLEERPH